jgi:hypothetical protein
MHRPGRGNGAGFVLDPCLSEALLLLFFCFVALEDNDSYALIILLILPLRMMMLAFSAALFHLHNTFAPGAPGFYTIFF